MNTENTPPQNRAHLSPIIDGYANPLNSPDEYGFKTSTQCTKSPSVLRSSKTTYNMKHYLKSGRNIIKY